MDIIIVLLSLFGYKNTRRNGQIRKIMGQFSEKIRTIWTGFIRQWTDLIRQWTGLICARIKTVRWRIKPVCQRIKPVHLVLNFFSYISLFLQLFAFYQKKVTIWISVKKTRLFWYPMLIYWIIPACRESSLKWNYWLRKHLNISIHLNHFCW